jgi:hypothetical protein
MPVNPSYSRGQRSGGLRFKPIGANSSRDPISKKNPSQKRAGRMSQGVGPKFKPQNHKKKGRGRNVRDTSNTIF